MSETIMIIKSNAKRAVGADGVAAALLAVLALFLKALKAMPTADPKAATAAMAATIRAMTGRLVATGEKGGKGHARHHLGTHAMTDAMSNALGGRWSKARLTAAMADLPERASIFGAMDDLITGGLSADASKALKAAIIGDLESAMAAIESAVPMATEDEAVMALRPLLALLRALDGKEASTGRATIRGRYEALTAVKSITEGSIDGLIEGRQEPRAALRAAMAATIWAKRPTE